jgi:hypothetical protein
MNLMRDEKTFKDGKPPKKTWPRPEDPLAPGGRIGARLRALYAEIEQEPIPMDLIELLEQLDEAERRQRK